MRGLRKLGDQSPKPIPTKKQGSTAPGRVLTVEAERPILDDEKVPTCRKSPWGSSPLGEIGEWVKFFRALPSQDRRPQALLSPSAGSSQRGGARRPSTSSRLPSNSSPPPGASGATRSCGGTHDRGWPPPARS